MSDTERVWELMKKISICMLASWDGKELQARPMGAYVRPEENAVFFLADRCHHKDDDMKTYTKVCLAFSDTSSQKYVSVAGNAESVSQLATTANATAKPIEYCRFFFIKGPSRGNQPLFENIPILNPGPSQHKASRIAHRSTGRVA